MGSGGRRCVGGAPEPQHSHTCSCILYTGNSWGKERQRGLSRKLMYGISILQPRKNSLEITYSGEDGEKKDITGKTSKDGSHRERCKEQIQMEKPHTWCDNKTVPRLPKL